MTEPRVVSIWTVLAIAVPAFSAALGASLALAFHAGGWKASDVAQAAAFVDFREETRSELGKIRTDVADIRAVVCATDLKRCRIKSASEDSEDTRRASVR